MDIRILIFTILCSLPLGLLAQWCATDLAYEHYRLSDERFGARMAHTSDWIRQLEGGVISTRREHRTIEVVFHVVWDKEEHNIPDAQVLSILDALNRDFQGYGRRLEVPDHMKDHIAEMDIGFCPVMVDGRPLIIRKQTSINLIGNKLDGDGRFVVHYDDRGGSSPLDPERYLNIWIADLPDNFLGRAAFPGMAAYPEEDGIVVDPVNAGYTDLASDDFGKTATHEVGHYLGLYHPWGPGGGSCNVDDEVEDTPLQSYIYFNCPANDFFSCGSADALQNFMQVQRSKCLQYFTSGQVARMEAVLAGPRADIVSGGNCIAQPPESASLEDAIRLRYDLAAPLIDIYIIDNIPFSYTYELYDMHGRLWRSGGSQARYNQIIFSSPLPAAVYFLRLSGLGDSFMRKLVVIGN